MHLGCYFEPKAITMLLTLLQNPLLYASVSNNLACATTLPQHRLSTDSTDSTPAQHRHRVTPSKKHNPTIPFLKSVRILPLLPLLPIHCSLPTFLLTTSIYPCILLLSIYMHKGLQDPSQNLTPPWRTQSCSPAQSTPPGSPRRRRRSRRSSPQSRCGRSSRQSPPWVRARCRHRR